MRLLIVLQNAYWSIKTEQEQPIGRPLFTTVSKVFHRIQFKTMTDKRLQMMIPFGFDIIYGNASNMIGTEASSYYPYNEEHVKLLISNSFADIILLGGKEAKKSISIIKGKYPYLAIPHPAARFISNKFCLIVRYKLLDKAIQVMEGKYACK